MQKIEPKTIGHFDLIEQVGVGAFGSVWKARDTELDRTVAVKIPRKGQLDPSEAEQFLREARSAAQLKHPNIVSVHEVGRDDGQTYIVSDFIEGLPLSSWLTGRQLTFKEAVELCGKIAEALHHAHESGVIHRDLKPSNIMLDADGEPHIMDFGLAKREAGEITMTVDGKVLGTPAYMSPEQARGESHAANRRTDVYSLGVILFEMLTGDRPFRGDYRMLLHQVIHEEAPGPRKLKATVPRDLDTICRKCLEKDPVQRYMSAKKVADELRRFRQGEPIQARPISTTARSWRWCKRNPSVASLTGSLITVLLTLSVVGPTIAVKQSRLAAANQQLADDEREARNEADREKRQAQETRTEAERQLRIATSQRLAGESQAVDNKFTVRGLLLGAEAIEVTRRHAEPVVPVAHEAVLNSVLMMAGRTLGGHTDTVSVMAISPDSRWLVTGSRDTTARLWDLTAEDLADSSIVLRGHGIITSVAISPDGRWLVTGGHDKTARRWDLLAENPAETSIVLRHEYSVMLVAITPDGQRLVTGSADGTPRLWDLTADDPANSSIALQKHEDMILGSIAISPDGHWLATGASSKRGTRDCPVPLWDLSAEDPTESLRLLPGQDQRVSSVAISPNGRWLVTAGVDNTRLWDLSADKPEDSSIVLPAPQSGSRTVAISPDSRWLFTGGRDKTGRLWELTADNPADSPILLRGHESAISSAAINPDGRWLVTGSSDKTARLWDLTAENPANSSIVLRGHESEISSVTISPDSHWLVTGSADGSARLWDFSTESPATSPRVLNQHRLRFVQRIAISSDGRWLVTRYRLWDLTADNPADSAIDLRGHQGFVAAFEVSPDSRWLATGGEDKTVRLWDLSVADPNDSPRVLLGHEEAISSLAITPDSRRLVSGSKDSIRMWDLTADNTAESPIVLPGHKDLLNIITIGPNSRWLVTVSTEIRTQLSTLRLCDLSADNPAESSIDLLGHERPVGSVRFSPDGRWLATGSLDKTARLWDLSVENPADSPIVLPGQGSAVYILEISPDGRWLVTIFDKTARLQRLTSDGTADSSIDLRGHHRDIRRAAISPDSRWLVTADSGGTPRLWDLAAENPADSSIVLREHESFVTFVAISPNSRWLVTGSIDKTARLWDLTADDPNDSLRVLQGHIERIDSGVISPDSRWVVTASQDSIRLWDLDIDSLLDHARRLTGREFTGREINQHHLPLTLHREASLLVASVSSKYVLRQNVVDAILQDGTLSEELRQEALAIANKIQEDPNQLNEASWSVVSVAGQTLEQYRKALQQAEAACQHMPDYAINLNTLGVAQYRVGQYDQAVVTLSRSDELNSGSQPINAAFLAMAHHRLGHAEEAEELLKRCRRLVEDHRSAESRGFLGEAESLLNREVTPQP